MGPGRPSLNTQLGYSLSGKALNDKAKIRNVIAPNVEGNNSSSSTIISISYFTNSNCKVKNIVMKNNAAVSIRTAITREEIV